MKRKSDQINNMATQMALIPIMIGILLFVVAVMVSEIIRLENLSETQTEQGTHGRE